VTVVLDALQLPAPDRADAIRHIIGETMVRVDIDFDPDTGSAAAAGAITDLGDLTICSVRSNALTVSRTAALARDDLRPSVFLGMQVGGTSHVEQRGRRAALQPGELVLYDSTEPYVLSDPDGIRQHFFRVPIDRLALPHNVVRQVCAVTLSPGHPVADLAAAYFRRLAARPDLFEQPGAQAISQPSIELIRALITTHLDATELGKGAMHATLHLRIMEYLRAHLHEPGLSAAQVAAEHHISVRQLYKVLGAAGVSLGDWIRAERLERCRRALAQPGARSGSIASVSRGSGFTDPSGFARMFRAVYGMSPRQWRDLPHSATT
jgi:AraC-like DNA-binding protein